MGGDALTGDGILVAHKDFRDPLRLETTSSRGEEKGGFVLGALAFGEPALAKPGKSVLP